MYERKKPGEREQPGGLKAGLADITNTPTLYIYRGYLCVPPALVAGWSTGCSTSLYNLRLQSPFSELRSIGRGGTVLPPLTVCEGIEHLRAPQISYEI